MRYQKINLNPKKDGISLERSAQNIRKITEEHGAEIKGVYYITKSELSPSIHENTDSSLTTKKGFNQDYWRNYTQNIELYLRREFKIENHIEFRFIVIM